MQWETLKGEAGGVQRFSSCQQISLKEQNAAFFFLRHSWCITDISALLHLQDDGVCMRLVNYKSGTKLHVWWRLFPHVSFSLLCLVHMSTGGCWEFVCTYFPKKTCLSLSAMLFFCFHVVGLHPNVQTCTCSLERRPNPQLIQSTTGLQADFLQTSRWYVQRADFINSSQYWRDVTWHYLNRLGQKQNWTKSGYRNM